MTIEPTNKPHISFLPLLTALGVTASIMTPMTAWAQEDQPASSQSSAPSLPSMPQLPEQQKMPELPGAPSTTEPPASASQAGASEQQATDDQTTSQTTQNSSLTPTIPASQMPFPAMGQLSPPVLSTPATLAAGGAAVPPPEFQLKLGAKGSETWTDNTYLTAHGRQSDFITTIEPNVSISERTRRLNIGVNYDLGYDRYISNPKQSGFRHNGTGIVSTELIDQVLFLDTRGTVSEQAINPTAANSAGTRTSPTNTALVATYSVTPTFQQRLGRWSLAQLSYTHDQTFSSSDNTGESDTASALSSTQASASAAIDDKAKAELHSGENFSRLLWDYSTQLQLHDSRSATNRATGSYRQMAHTLQTEYKLTDVWGILSEVGYDNLSGGDIDSDKFSGVFYSGGLHWTPSSDIDVRISDGRRYDNNEIYGLGQFKLGPRTSFRVSQQSGVSTDSQSYAEALQATQRDASGAFIDPFSGLPASPSTHLFDASSVVYRHQTTRVAFNHAGDRDGLTLSLQYAEQKPLNSTPVLITTYYGSVLSGTKTTGEVDGQWTHQFTPALSSKTSLSLNDVLSAQQTGSKMTSLRAGVGLDYLLNTSLTSSLSLQHQDSWQKTGGNIEEDLVTVGLRKTF